jgi:Flp pilus assembly secretin CpaC
MTEKHSPTLIGVSTAMRHALYLVERVVPTPVPVLLVGATGTGAARQLLVKDGQRIVLGGLGDRLRNANQSGIPILSRLPILRGLFGSADRSTFETELYLSLTPRILKTDADADSVTAPRLPKAIGVP